MMRPLRATRETGERVASAATAHVNILTVCAVTTTLCLVAILFLLAAKDA